ncbi:uncharacterized protein LOC115880091 [Sitophilus oryzae]|uniref:Uncharacterized protein LOC115880091 n=1 Tax=Sitophilus oryzae TaxID=7048 RepID=A0A6J2XPS9_SITOR|nr:uncharacterized protein LOC115880091 [Sitophilus oryzae]
MKDILLLILWSFIIALTLQLQTNDDNRTELTSLNNDEPNIVENDYFFDSLIILDENKTMASIVRSTNGSCLCGLCYRCNNGSVNTPELTDYVERNDTDGLCRRLIKLCCK